MATETVPVDKAALEAIQKQLDESKAAIAKLEIAKVEAEKKAEAAEKATKEATDIAKTEMNLRKLAEFTKRAETEFPLLPGKPEEKGGLLKAMSEKLSPEEFKQAEALLTSGQAFANKSHAFSVVGRSGAPASGGAWEKVEAMAKERISKGATTMTKEQAIDAILREDQELAKQVVDEESAA